MNAEDFKLACPKAAESALQCFGDKVSEMDFIVRVQGCSTFMKVTGGYYQWYWYDQTKNLWRDSHLLKDNWLDPRAKQ
jgi:hypothetical protein